ncbi:CAP domain-containing protein [Ectobacillus funiculus]|uniref:CAP domain-containing protein n=1 Tax=Ectobacillus funiculus TaxID=137993 RepID=UPI00397A224E
MRKFRIFTTATVLSLSLLTVSGCGTNRDTALNDNTVNRHNVSTNDMGRTDRTDLRTVGTDRNGDLRINRDNGLWPDRNDRNVGLRTNPDNALPARNARGYISPNPVSFTPTGGYTRLCPCPNQATPNTTTPGTTTTTPKTTTPGTTTAPGTQATGGTVDATEARVVELTNAERRKNGLRDLQVDNSLANVAQAKSNDMLSKNYFSHTSPTYGSPFDMMRSFGISYSYAGENIAKGQRSADEVVQAWMNSPGHRANILNGNYTHIGIGHTSSQDYWTQMFIGKK